MSRRPQKLRVSFARSCPKRPCAVRPCSHSIALPCSYSHCPAATRTACPNPHVAPCCSPRVALYCPTRRTLLPCTAGALLPCPPRPAATTAAAAARATAAAGGGAAGSAGSAAGAGGAGGATRSARGATGSAGGASGAGRATGIAGGAAGAGVARGGQQRSLPLPDDPTPQQLHEWQSQQETFSPQVLSELLLQRCVTGYVEAAALGASESVAALGASESAAALGARASPATGPSSAEALNTFTLNSGASRCFFCDCTTLTQLAAPVPVSLADPTGGPLVVRASTVLPCPAVPSGSLSGLHLPAFSTNLVSNATIQDVWVDTFIPGGLIPLFL
ncbi:unnamed protein product [Closterium sp. NIES-54]